MVRGIQSQGVSACVKHYAVNSQETGRMGMDEVVDERLENNRQALLSQAVRWLASPGENSQKSHK